MYEDKFDPDLLNDLRTLHYEDGCTVYAVGAFREYLLGGPKAAPLLVIVGSPRTQIIGSFDSAGVKDMENYYEGGGSITYAPRLTVVPALDVVTGYDTKRAEPATKTFRVCRNGVFFQNVTASPGAPPADVVTRLTFGYPSPGDRISVEGFPEYHHGGVIRFGVQQSGTPGTYYYLAKDAEALKALLAPGTYQYADSSLGGKAVWTPLTVPPAGTKYRCWWGGDDANPGHDVIVSVPSGEDIIRVGQKALTAAGIASNGSAIIYYDRV